MLIFCYILFSYQNSTKKEFFSNTYNKSSEFGPHLILFVEFIRKNLIEIYLLCPMCQNLFTRNFLPKCIRESLYPRKTQ